MAEEIKKDLPKKDSPRKEFDIIDFENKSVVIVLVSVIIILIVLFQIAINICKPESQITKEKMANSYTGKGIAFITTLDEVDLQLYEKKQKTQKIRKNSCGIRLYKGEDSDIVFFYDYTLGSLKGGSVYLHNNLLGFVFYIAVFVFIPISIVICAIIFLLNILQKRKFRRFYNNRIKDDMKNKIAIRIEKIQGSINKYIEDIELIDSKSTIELQHLILETDVLLENILVELNVKGKTLGERLKKMSDKMFDIKTIRDARSAHAIRNILAHSHDSSIPREQLYRAVYAYKSVFEKMRILLNTKPNR